MLKAKQVILNKIKISTKTNILFLDISRYYDSALDTDSVEVLQKLSKDSNKLMYIAFVMGVLILLLSILVHFYKSD